MSKNMQLGLEEYFPRSKEHDSYETYEANFKKIVKIYKQMVTIDIHHTLALESYQKDKFLNWPLVKEIVIKDLAQKTRTIDKEYINNQNGDK